MKKIILIEELDVGMFVSGITQSKGNLIVKSQGMIKNPGTIESLKQKGILELEVDVDKSDFVFVEPESPELLEEPHQKVTTEKRTIQPISKPIDFEDQKQAFSGADKLYTEAKEIHSRFFTTLKQGQAPDFDSLNNLSQEIIDSVFDNADALSCLVMLKETNNYLVEHALNNSILLTIFAKYRGYSQSVVEDLTMAGLLMDCGMALLPNELVKSNEELSETDQGLIRTHVDISFEIAERFSDVAPIVLDVIANHHERIDGSGYPKQKTADEISEYAQMAAIVDMYDDLLTDKPYRGSVNAQKILENMQKDASLNTELVNEFVEAIGMFPIGSLVALKSGKLAIVVQRNPDNPLEPIVMSFYSIRSKAMTEVKRIDLKRQTSDKILSSVSPEEFDINLPNFFRNALTGS